MDKSCRYLERIGSVQRGGRQVIQEMSLYFVICAGYLSMYYSLIPLSHSLICSAIKLSSQSISRQAYYERRRCAPGRSSKADFVSYTGYLRTPKMQFVQYLLKRRVQRRHINQAISALVQARSDQHQYILSLFHASSQTISSPALRQ